MGAGLNKDKYKFVMNMIFATKTGEEGERS